MEGKTAMATPFDDCSLLNQPVEENNHKHEDRLNLLDQSNDRSMSLDKGGFNPASHIDLAQNQAFELPLISIAQINDSSEGSLEVNEKTPKDALLELARKNISKDKHFEEFEENLNNFELRATQESLPESEFSQTLANIGRLFEGDSSSPIEHKTFVKLAQQVMLNAAHPQSIDQGKHNTCTAQTLEVRAYMRTPSSASGLVADIATKNEFYTKDGTLIKLDKYSMTPDDESKQRLPRYGERSFASQIFSIAAINAYWLRVDQDFDGSDVSKGSFRFGQFEELRGRKIDGNAGITFDPGERVVDMRTSPPSAILERPFVDSAELEEVYRQITKSYDSDFVFTSNADLVTGVIELGDKETLVSKLSQMKEANNLPAVWIVHTTNEPWFELPGTWHAINLVDIDDQGEKIKISNQYGNRSDRDLNPDTLIKAGLGDKPYRPMQWIRR